MTRLYLASRSPRRSELLTQIGVRHEVVVTNIDETLQPDESPQDYVVRLAAEKAKEGHNQIGQPANALILAADTAVVADGEILGKPNDREQATAMLLRLSGCRHQVLTGVALLGEQMETRLNSSVVTFRQISQQEACDYYLSGEPADKAGGYAIQGLGAQFIPHLEGSYSGVMGLPLFETAQLLHQAGVPTLLVNQSKSTLHRS